MTGGRHLQYPVDQALFVCNKCSRNSHRSPRQDMAKLFGNSSAQMRLPVFSLLIALRVDSLNFIPIPSIRPCMSISENLPLMMPLRCILFCHRYSAVIKWLSVLLLSTQSAACFRSYQILNFIQLVFQVFKSVPDYMTKMKTSRALHPKGPGMRTTESQRSRKQKCKSNHLKRCRKKGKSLCQF